MSAADTVGAGDEISRSARNDAGRATLEPIRRIHLDQCHLGDIDEDLPRVFEIYRHAVADGGLNLAETPAGFGGVADVHAGEQVLCHIKGFGVAGAGDSCLPDSILLRRAR